MTYTGHTSTDHPETGAEIAITVTFRVHPPEPEIGTTGPLYEVIQVSSDCAPLTSDDGEVDAHVYSLPDAWFAEVVRGHHEGLADYRLEQRREARP